MTEEVKNSERKREKEEREGRKVYRQADREGGKGPDLCQHSDPYAGNRQSTTVHTSPSFININA